MADSRLGPSRRIKSRNDFLRIQSKSRKIKTAHFLLALDFPSDSQGSSGRESRIGVTITTKVDKRATRRNTLRRRIREIFRTSREQLRHPVDVVVIALSGATTLDFSAIKEELHSAFAKAKLYKYPRAGTGST